MTERDIWLWAYSRSNAAEFNATFAAPRIVVGEIPRTPTQFAELRNLKVVGLDLGFGSYTTGEVNAAWVTQARNEGFFTCGYTVVSPSVMNTMIDLGVDFIETDYPDMVARAGRPPAVLSLTSQQLRQGQTFTLTATTEPGARVQWTRDGQPIAAGPTPWGSLVTFSSLSQTLTIANALAEDSGMYAATVISPCGVTPVAPVAIIAGCGYDYNQDENVDILDAQLMAQVAAGVITRQPTWLDGDLNQDENADLNDAQQLATYIVSGICSL
jgi:hypothetical protein